MVEKVRLALRDMGFLDEQARRAIAAVMKQHDDNQSFDVVEALRKAILVATAA